ncbi:MAG: hypothetical protein ACD_24C00509G0004 [uncultured bacterium]|nr:MAG: hypothetical protein ACD_24C00509G0004 [uncultured bacterium]
MVTIKIRNNMIQTMRIKKGLSLRNLANKAEINYVTISNLENGKTSPSPSTTLKICNALETQFDELFEIVGCNKPQAQEAV